LVELFSEMDDEPLVRLWNGIISPWNDQGFDFPLMDGGRFLFKEI
jgi:hypothetical protein